MTNVIRLKEYCETHGIDYKRARRMARKGQFPGTQKLLADANGKGGIWAVDADAPAPTFTTTTRGTTREDGRQRYTIYLTPNEYVDIGQYGYEIGNPREAARERRLARKAAQTDGDNDTN